MRSFALTFALLACSSSEVKPDGGGSDGGGGFDAGVSGPEQLPGKGACSTDGFCWFQPSTHGEDIYAAWAANDKDLWGVGSGGAIVHYDGQAWQFMRSGTDLLEAIWGSSATSVWAAGNQTLIHWEGSSWTPVTVTGAPSSAWWRRIAARSDKDLWLFGGSDMAHFDGAAWEIGKLSTTAGTVDAKIVGPEVWLLRDATVVRVTTMTAPQTTMQLPAPPSSGAYKALVVLSPTDAWAVGTKGAGAHYDGTAWQAMPLTGEANYAAAGPNGEVLGVYQGGVYSLQNQKWQRRVSVTGNPSVTESLHHLFVTTEGHIWATGSGGATGFYNGDKWYVSGGRITTSIGQVHASASDNLWISGTFDPHRWDGTTWKGFDEGDGFVGAIWASDKTHVWAVRGVFNDSVVAVQGTAAIRSVTGFKLFDMWGMGLDDVWAAGTTLIHWNGTAWEDRSLPAAGSWISVWQSSPTDVWLASTVLGLYRGDGATWAPVTAGAITKPALVRGTSASDVWVVQTSTPYDVMHFDTTWTSRKPPESIGSLWVATSDDAWGGGISGKVLHYSGGTWTTMALPTAGTSRGIWSQAGDVWVGTSEGGVLRKQ